MAKLIKIFFVLFLLIALVFIFNFFSSLTQIDLSKDQEKTISLFGHPDQFMITYLPSGTDEKPALSRFESWYYYAQRKKINFLKGKAVSGEEYNPSTITISTTLHPEDFTFDMNYNDLSEIVGKDNLNTVDFIVGFEKEAGVKIYTSSKGLFVIEDNSLTYMQTFAINPEEIETDLFEDNYLQNQKAKTDDGISTASWKTYFNNDLNITLKYPPHWYLADNDVVLTNYDSNFLAEGKPAPENPLKCDFEKYTTFGLEIQNKQVFTEGAVTVSKGKAIDKSESGGPGLGQAVFFLMEDGKNESIGLLCYMYQENEEETLRKMLSTFKFIK